jgi:paraquat-inducible protein B
VSGAGEPPEAETAPPASAGPVVPAWAETGRGFSLIWLIPVVALLIGAWLGYRWLTQEGPVITITFNSAEGLTAGQTEIRHKAVSLGTVKSISLSHDMSHVIVRARMRKDSEPALTDQARFWVVRPRLTAGNISGLETIVSGSYIELDPGSKRGASQTEFTGLESPPPIRSDEPGRSFVLRGQRLGSVTIGSSVYYRDVVVGEVLGYDIGKPGDPVTVYAFVRAPFDDYIHEGSYFWNASGISVEVGANGLRLQLQSVQAILAGGIAFDTPNEALRSPVAPANAEFPLFDDQATAASAHFTERVHFLVRVHSSVRGLAVGAPVTLYGIQVGIVSGVRLRVQPEGNEVVVEVQIEIEPGRLPHDGPMPTPDKVVAGISNLVRHGLRAQLRSSNFLTGQLEMALDFFPDSDPAAVTVENNEHVLPSEPADLENIQRNLGDISRKLGKIPFDQLGENLNRLLVSADKIVQGPELHQSLRDLAQTLRETKDLMAKADAGATPALRRLPAMTEQLQNTIAHAGSLLAGLNNGAGADSAVARQLSRTLDEASAALRSVRVLADYLDTHPEALIRGRVDTGNDQAR